MGRDRSVPPSQLLIACWSDVRVVVVVVVSQYFEVVRVVSLLSSLITELLLRTIMAGFICLELSRLGVCVCYWGLRRRSLLTLWRGRVFIVRSMSEEVVEEERNIVYLFRCDWGWLEDR